jgi:hypothetical protein
VPRSWCLWLLAAACARAGTGVAPGDDDPLPPDSSTDCTQQTYYRDADGDGHGDPAMAMQACEPPAGTVTSNDDCDDTTAQRRPGLDEICDGLDNDCTTATLELCPAGCSPIRRPPPDDQLHVYLVCNVSAPWANARATCNGAMYKLVQIESAAENAFVRTTANTFFGGVDLHIGGTDSVVEGTWVWDGSDPFWQGTSGGAPIGGRYANWVGGEPNNDSNEDCTEMKPTGQWNDENCGDSQRFLCRR